MCALGAVVALALGARGPGLALAALSLIATAPLFVKWRNRLARLPVILLVPYVMVAALALGALRARRLTPRAAARS